MKRARRFGAFWWDFVVGDDWVVAVGIVARARGRRRSSARAGIAAWWLLPLVVAALLALSLRRAIRGLDLPPPHL